MNYSDKWGDILDRPDDNCVEIRWFDTTSQMDGDDFNNFLTRFAEQVETCGRSGCLVDAVQFRMDMGKMNNGWRDANIIPRYNAANVKKFAFVMPAGTCFGPHACQPASSEARACDKRIVRVGNRLNLTGDDVTCVGRSPVTRAPAATISLDAY